MKSTNSTYKVAISFEILLTGKDLMVHTTRFFSGTYFAWPVLVLNFGESASLGTGTRTSTLFATDCFLNCPLAWRENKLDLKEHALMLMLNFYIAIIT